MKSRMLMPIPRSLPAGAAAATAFISVPSCSTTLVAFDTTLLLQTLLAELRERAIRLFQREPHPAHDALGLGELDLAIVDDLYVVSPRVAERAVRRARHLDARILERSPDRRLVVDDEAEMPLAVD